MLEKVEWTLDKLLSWTRLNQRKKDKEKDAAPMKVIKKGSAMRVIFFYPGEEGTYVDNAEVTLFENGIVYIRSSQEETTTHLQNCEILWRFETEAAVAEDRASKVRLLKPKAEADARSIEEPSSKSESTIAPNPELRD